ncbi:MAG: cbb3-type cytochrome c oxidase subunit I [Candidatus Hydrothermarchaeota archaeon]
MATESPLERLDMEPREKGLISAFIAMGLVSLGLGVLAALVVASARVPALPLAGRALYYKALTFHAIFTLFYWFTFFQAGLLVGAVPLLMRGRRLYSLRLGWLAFALLLLGFLLDVAGILMGADVLYTAFPPLATGLQGSSLVYLGYVLGGMGALLITVNYLLTVVGLVERKGEAASWRRMLADIPISAFAGLVAVVLIIPTSLASLRVFAPALLAAMAGAAPDPLVYRENFLMMFHVFHYIPAMTMIGVAYMLVELVLDAKSVYSKNVAKALFVLYPAVVPPTFFYHLLVDPTTSPLVKGLGSSLSLLIGMPTILHMFIILGMMEARVRSAGHGGLFAWMRHLPWRNPAFVCLAMGMLTMGLGGVLSYTLIHWGASEMLHGTFAVPAYIHPIAAGGPTLIYMGGAYYLVTGLTRRQLRYPSLARLQPCMVALGLLIFGTFGSIAGYLGVPRRTPEISYSGLAPSAWSLPMNIAVGIGAVLTALGILTFLFIVGATALRGERAEGLGVFKGLEPPALPVVREVKETPTALVPGIVFICLAILLTILAFQLMEAWPISFR